MTIIPELYSNLDSIFNSDQQEDNPSDENFIEPKWKQALRYTLYGIGAVDAINVGLQGHSSVVLVMHDLLNIDPYGYIMNLGLLCGISTVLCQFSFFSKKGIDDTMNDLQKYINRSNTDAPQLIIEEGKTETSQLLSV